MANEPIYGKGIVVASGFDLSAKSPLDTRSVVNTIQERDAHVANNRAYVGMTVYVISENKEYRYNGSQWDAQAIPTKVSELVNDSAFATETFVTTKIAEAKLEGESIDLSGYATKDDLKLYTTTVDLSANYATKAYVDEKILPLDALIDDVGALTTQLQTHDHPVMNQDDVDTLLTELNDI